MAVCGGVVGAFGTVGAFGAVVFADGVLDAYGVGFVVSRRTPRRALSGLRALLDIERLTLGPHASRRSRPM